MNTVEKGQGCYVTQQILEKEEKSNRHQQESKWKNQVEAPPLAPNYREI